MWSPGNSLWATRKVCATSTDALACYSWVWRLLPGLLWWRPSAISRLPTFLRLRHGRHCFWFPHSLSLYAQKDRGRFGGAARWLAFKRYLKDIDRYTDLTAQKEIWDRWLPYAIAFGVDKEYIRKFEKVDAPAPGWYIPDPTLYGPYRRWYYGNGGPARR